MVAFRKSGGSSARLESHTVTYIFRSLDPKNHTLIDDRNEVKAQGSVQEKGRIMSSSLTGRSALTTHGEKVEDGQQPE